MALSHFPSSLTVALLLLSTSLSATANEEACQSNWLPLQAGNYWVYRVDSRFSTGSFRTIRALGPYEFEGRIWCQIEDPIANYLVRVDAEGRIFKSFFSTSESLLLDPRNLSRRDITSDLGFTSTAVDFPSPGLQTTNSTYVRNIGLVLKTANLQSGSSGGFVSSETLIEAFIDGKLYKQHQDTSPKVQLELATQFQNCAVPCYYVACGLGSPVDPPGANKPCLQARLAATNLSPGSSLLLTISSGTLQYSHHFPLSNTQPILYQSIPFYEQSAVGSPIQPFPKGDYFITLTALNAGAQPLTTTSTLATAK